MKRLLDLTAILSRRDRSCARDNVLVRFTGEPPRDQREYLIRTAAANRTSVPLGWLEERLAHDLYRAELSQGAAALDIGAWGPALYREEAARMITDMRPEFGYRIEERGHAEAGGEQRERA